MKTKHSNIDFTFEVEDQSSSSFLDIKIIRSTEWKTFETSVYRESIFSGVFANFKSFVPMIYKIGLFRYYFTAFQYALPMKSFSR